MKAYRKKDNKLIDVKYVGSCLSKGVRIRFYMDTQTNRIYTDKQLELKEYYGG